MSVGSNQSGNRKQEAKLKNSARLAKRVAKKHRLTPEQLAGHPDLDAQAAQLPVAHTACETNPVGLGFAEAWFLKATGQKLVAAPQIEYPETPLTASFFWKALRGKLKAKHAKRLAPAGFGIRYKGHPQRSDLLGTVDDAFIASDAWLPADFDFAVWNAAPPDQQTDFLVGDERLELVNLCALDTPGASREKDGSTRLRLELPRHDCFALLRLDSGAMNEVPLVIDTLLIEPETRTLTLVWRLSFMKDADAPVRVIEARLRPFAERDALATARRVLAEVAENAEKAARALETDRAWA